MDISQLISLMNSINSGNANAQAGGVMNFFAQNQQNDKNQNTQQSMNNSTLNLNQILPLLSMLGSQNVPNIASLLPLLSMINSPNGLAGLSNIPGMQNFAPIMENVGKAQTAQTENNIIRLKGNDKNITDYKKI